MALYYFVEVNTRDIELFSSTALTEVLISCTDDKSYLFSQDRKPI